MELEFNMLLILSQIYIIQLQMRIYNKSFDYKIIAYFNKKSNSILRVNITYNVWLDSFNAFIFNLLRNYRFIPIFYAIFISLLEAGIINFTQFFFAVILVSKEHYSRKFWSYFLYFVNITVMLGFLGSVAPKVGILSNIEILTMIGIYDYPLESLRRRFLSSVLLSFLVGMN
jgi:hypothetical protein